MFHTQNIFMRQRLLLASKIRIRGLTMKLTYMALAAGLAFTAPSFAGEQTDAALGSTCDAYSIAQKVMDTSTKTSDAGDETFYSREFRSADNTNTLYRVVFTDRHFPNQKNIAAREAAVSAKRQQKLSAADSQYRQVDPTDRLVMIIVNEFMGNANTDSRRIARAIRVVDEGLDGFVEEVEDTKYHGRIEDQTYFKVSTFQFEGSPQGPERETAEQKARGLMGVICHFISQEAGVNK